MSERNYYCLCEDNCKFPTMTAEQIIEAIAEATGNTPTNVDDAFITKVREQNGNADLLFWLGTSAEYAALETYENNCFYILTDDTTSETIANRINSIALNLESFIEQTNENLSAQMQGATYMLNGSISNDDPQGLAVDGTAWKQLYFDLNNAAESFPFVVDNDSETLTTTFTATSAQRVEVSASCHIASNSTTITKSKTLVIFKNGNPVTQIGEKIVAISEYIASSNCNINLPCFIFDIAVGDEISIWFGGNGEEEITGTYSNPQTYVTFKCFGNVVTNGGAE